eukprot:533909-Pyramimonas_sp.AAC.2
MPSGSVRWSVPSGSSPSESPVKLIDMTYAASNSCSASCDAACHASAGGGGPPGDDGWLGIGLSARAVSAARMRLYSSILSRQ